MLLWLSLLYTTNIRFSVQSLPLFVSPATIIIPTIRTSTTKQTAVAAAAAASRLQQRILQQQRQRYVVSTTYDGFGLSPFVTTTVTSLSLSSAGNGDYSSSSYVEDGTSTIHDDDDDDRREVLRVRNTSYVKGLIQNLENVLDQYILTNENSYNEQAYNIFELIKQHTVDDDVIVQAIGMIQHAGLSESNANNKSNTSENRNEGSAAKNSNEKLLGKTDEVERKKKAETRKQWEEFRSKQASNVAAGGRSALSRRQMNDSNRPDGLFLNNFALNTKTQSDQLLSDKQYLERIAGTSNSTNPKMENFVDGDSNNNDIAIKASTIVSEYVAKAGGISNFDGQSLGIGGLDDVLGQIKRRVWIPLAAPPILLHELGIQPVRGLLLYGKSGNGKTLLARTIGRLLSPLRYVRIKIFFFVILRRNVYEYQSYNIEWNTV